MGRRAEAPAAPPPDRLFRRSFDFHQGRVHRRVERQSSERVARAGRFFGVSSPSEFLGEASLVRPLRPISMHTSRATSSSRRRHGRGSPQTTIRYGRLRRSPSTSTLLPLFRPPLYPGYTHSRRRHSKESVTAHLSTSIATTARLGSAPLPANLSIRPKNTLGRHPSPAVRPAVLPRTSGPMQ